MSDAAVLDEVEQCSSRVHSDGIIEDYCDGIRFKTHPIFASDPCALQIIAFFDELELCNPLGTHVKKHKLAIVLFTLGNIHPKYRSSLQAIHLAIAATVPLVERYGIDEILKPFVKDLNILAAEGVRVVTQPGVERTFYGGLLLCLGDNLGSNTIGGFKESFSFSLRFCRTCYVTQDVFKTLSDSSQLELRSDEKHCQECDSLNGPLHDHFSKTYGINRRSSLLEVSHFSLFNGGLAHDVMHDLLEGVAAIEMCLLLQHCLISKQYLNLDEYNHRLIHFDYEYTEISKPQPIGSCLTLQNAKSLKLSASQSLLLVRILPLLIGDVVPLDDQKWKCFLLLSKIVDLALCSWSSPDLCAILKVTIEEHHRSFIEMYTAEAVTPKFHFLFHYPTQILNVGPMIRTWNMRNEAKLNIFKQASRLGNFKNIAYSIANRHQRLLCYELSTGNLLDSPLQCGPCDQPILIRNMPPHVQNSLTSLLPSISSETPTTRPNWVKYLGNTIKRNAYIITGCDGLHPAFARVVDILVLVDIIVLHVLHCSVEYYDDHYHAFVIAHTADQSYVCFSELKVHTILHAHRKSDILYVYLKEYFHAF